MSTALRWALAAGAAFCVSWPVVAQEPAATKSPSEKRNDELEKARRLLQFDINRMLRDGSFGSEDNRKKFRTFYELAFQQFVLDVNQAELPGSRFRRRWGQELKTAFSAPAKDVHKEFNQLLLENMDRIAADDTAPVVARYNAILQIGDLNEKEAVGFGGTGATPLPAALPILLRYYQDSKVPDAVRIGALVALHRHALEGTADKAAIAQLQTIMLKTFKETKVPPNFSQKAHEWVRRRAADILAVLHASSPNADTPDLVNSLVAALQEPDASLAFRGDVARALGTINYATARNADLTAAAKALGKLAMDAAESQVTARKALKAHLYCVQVGLSGPQEKQGGIVQAADKTSHKAFVDSVAQSFAEVMKTIDDTRADADLPKKVPQAVAKLKQLVDPSAAAEPAATPPAAGTGAAGAGTAAPSTGSGAR